MKLRGRLATLLLSLGLILPLAGLAPTQYAAADPMPPAAAGDGIDPDLKLADITTNGVGGWTRYRIPALTQLENGDLIAVYDGRPTMNDLPSNIALLMRRSTDGGTTWGPQTVIRSDPAPNGYGDPSVIVDRTDGKVYVFYAASINQGFAGSSAGQDPTDPNVLHADYSVSSDNGATWATRRITADIKAGRAWAGMFAASGEGIQLRTGPKAGRLIQQYTVRINGGNYAVSVYSDDHGATWKTSAPVGPSADENKTVELSNGDVILNSRAAPARLVAKSTDGGETYTPFAADSALPDPANNGSIIRAYPDAPASDPKSKLLLFSNAANVNQRKNLTIRMSCDDGKTWPVSKLVQSGAVGYSTLTALKSGGERGGKYGLFYERDGYRYLSYTSFDLNWLGGVCASPAVTPTTSYIGGTPTATEVVVSNQSGADLSAGEIKVATGQRLSSPTVTVPAISAGYSATVSVAVTPDDTADTRTHDVRFEYTNSGKQAFTKARLSVLGGANALTWNTGATSDGTGDPLDLTTQLPQVATLAQGSISIDFTQTANVGVGTLFAASAKTASGSNVDLIVSVNSGKPYLEIRANGSGTPEITSSVTVANNRRYNLTITSTASGVTMYLDGVQVATSTTTGFFKKANDAVALDSLTIGGVYQSRPDRWMFNGTVHNVQVTGPVTADPSFKVLPVLDAIYTGGDAGLIGDKIQPWVEVVNTGNVPLSGITFSSPSGANVCNYSLLAPGASYACKNTSPSRIITQSDLIAGEWSTTYTATANSGAVSASGTLFPVNLVQPMPSAGDTNVWIPTDKFSSSSFTRVPLIGGVGTPLAADAPLSLRIPANSRASGQLAVSSKTALTGLKATATPLKLGATSLPADSIQIRYPDYIKDLNNPGSLVADPLRDVASVNLAAGQNQPIWFTVTIPKNANPGNYTAAVTLSHDGGSIGTWPITVNVPDVAYRDMADRPFTLDLWPHPDAIADKLSLPLWSEAHFQAMKPYWADLASRGQRVLNLAVTEDPWLVSMNGTIRPQTYNNYGSTVKWMNDGSGFTFDFSVFDRLVTDARAQGIGKRIHAFTMLQFRGYDRINYYNAAGSMVTETVTVGDARYTEAWTAFLTAFRAHLIAKGWFDDTSIAFDEQTLTRMNAAFAVIRAVDPAWADKIALAANSLAEADIAQYISFNYTFLGSVPQSLITQRRAAGKPTLFYTWNEPTLPNTVVKTPPFNSRTLGWVVEQRNLDGYLRWTYNSWPADIAANPAFRYDQGDEYIVYPGANGPVSSIRWELFKDGQEDAELLNLAKRALGAQNATLQAALTGVKPEGTTQADWKSMLTHRDAVIDALVKGPPAVQPSGPMTADKASVLDPNTGTITLSVPVKNTSTQPQTVTLTVADNKVFFGSATQTVPAGGTATVAVVISPQGRVGADSLRGTLMLGDQLILSSPFSLVSGGYYLSDAPWVGTPSNGWGPVERDLSNGEDGAGDGNPISLGGTRYTKGLGVHAKSTITYNLGGKCSALRFDYGIDDEVAGSASINFSVLGDGTQRWSSGLLTPVSPHKQSATVNVTGVNTLVLDVDPVGPNGQDHGDWAGIWVQCAQADNVAPVATAAVDQPARTVTIEATDNAYVASIEYQLDGGEWTAYTKPVVVGQAQTVVSYRATDAVGNVSEVQSLTVPAGTGGPVATVTVTSTATATVTATPPTVTITATVSAKPSPSATKSPRPFSVYEVPGLHYVNGRSWFTTCEAYSSTITRCRTEIWGTSIKQVNGAFVQTTGWVFNNLTYLPVPRAKWGSNPLAQPGRWTSAGRQWITECDTPATGKGACRSSMWAPVIEASKSPTGAWSYRIVNKWVFNNIVLFTD